jgi:hypothetical protein
VSEGFILWQDKGFSCELALGLQNIKYAGNSNTETRILQIIAESYSVNAEMT